MNEATTPQRFNIAVDTTGHMLCWGCGEFGQHGNGDKKVVNFLDGSVQQFCTSFEDFVKLVACGASHTAVVTNSGKLYLWGNGNNGQLGTSDLTTKLEPQELLLYTNQSDNLPIAGVACGGRHTMVWLQNGHVFGFGNNVHGQLGFDYNENQTRPIHLKFLMHRPVAQVACGEKHTIFRFQDGGIACTGNNTHGQIGSGDRKEATNPSYLSDICDPIKTIAAGAQHSLAVTASGQIYVWGYGKACGNRINDVLSPIRLNMHKQSVVAVSGGGTHSMALTANGSVYTWGTGCDGQLGHGEKIQFLSCPKRVKDRHVSVTCIQICCGEMFSSAVTENGLLYMWGKNSHTIIPDKPTSYKVFLPYGLNKNFRGGRISKVFCGSWHAVAIIGRPEILDRDESSLEESAVEEPTTNTDDNNEEAYEFENGSESDEEISVAKLETIAKEITTVSIADFYAPTPDLKKILRMYSPGPFFTNNNNVDDQTCKHNDSKRPAIMLPLPQLPESTYIDVATSPMTLTSTASSGTCGSLTAISRRTSCVDELPLLKVGKIYRKITRPEKRFKDFDAVKHEREKVRNATTAVSEVVQYSKTTADAFALRSDPTTISKKQVYFSEMGDIRLKGPRTKENCLRLNRHNETKKASSFKSRVRSKSKVTEQGLINTRDSVQPQSKLRYLDSFLSEKCDTILMESPLFKRSRNRVKSEMDVELRKVSRSLDDKLYKHHMPKQQRWNCKISSTYKEPDIDPHISRSHTTMPALHNEVDYSYDRRAQMKHYLALHNPPAAGKEEKFQSNKIKRYLPQHSPPTAGKEEKFRSNKPRHVSIPGGKTESPDDNREGLYVGAALKEKPVFSSSTSRKIKYNVDIFAPRKVAAAKTFKMYVTKNDPIRNAENSSYTSYSEGRGHIDELFDSGTFKVQSLLRREINNSDDSINGQLPDIAINNSNYNNNKNNNNDDDALTSRHPILGRKYCLDNEEMDFKIKNTSRLSRTDLIASRVS